MFSHTQGKRIMRMLSWALLLVGLSAFTLGCTGETVKPVETDDTTITPAEDGTHTHEDGEIHADHEEETTPPLDTPAPVVDEPAPVVEEPAPEGDIPAVPEGDADAPELDLDIEN
jgi:hypothetical protein